MLARRAANSAMLADTPNWIASLAIKPISRPSGLMIALMTKGIAAKRIASKGNATFARTPIANVRGPIAATRVPVAIQA